MANAIRIISLAVVLFGGVLDGRGAADDPPKQRAGPRVYKGRVIAPVMSAEGGGAEWLERRDRDATEQPEKVLDALKIAAGSTVADVGAGTGYFSLRMARRVGPTGRVLATDVQPEMLRLLNENSKKAGLRNVERILATASDARLPANQVDLAIMVDVYHELQDPERTMAQVRRALKQSGRLVLVEYRAEDDSVPIRPEHKTTLRQMRYEIEPMGFRLTEVFEFLPHQHVEVFVKDDVSGEGVLVDAAGFPTVRKPGWAGTPEPEPFEKAGFQRLFDGERLEGWTGDRSTWLVRGAAIVGRGTIDPEPGQEKGEAPAQPAAPELVSDRRFDQFELDLQWFVAGSNGSTAVRFGSDPAYVIRLDAGVPYEPGYPEVLAERRTGEVRGEPGGTIVLPTNDTARAIVWPGEWNRLTIRAAGDRVAVAVNGVATGEFDRSSQSAGPVALRLVRGEARFREIWVRAIEKQAPRRP